MINELKINLDELINVIKILIYKENKIVFEKIDFDDENVFLEPLLFAYFNSKREGLFNKDILTEILQGYLTESEQLLINESINHNGIAYLPNLGYYKNGVKIEDLLFIDSFEILKESHPVLKKYFIEYYRGLVIEENPNHFSAWRESLEDLNTSILIIKRYLPKFYEELTLANRKIYLHNNSRILNFTSFETLGMLYFYVIGKDNIIYFIEELIHQGAHNCFYCILNSKSDFFKIDSECITMRDLTKQQWDYRSVYGAFHGLYTVFKRVECFDILLQKNIFSGKDKHELLGRFTDQFTRFRNGLELLNLDEVYTEKGKQLYLE
jgi:hypothetical protein